MGVWLVRELRKNTIPQQEKDQSNTIWLSREQQGNRDIKSESPLTKIQKLKGLNSSESLTGLIKGGHQGRLQSLLTPCK